MRHFISVAELKEDDVAVLLEQAEFRLAHPTGQTLAHAVVGTCFLSRAPGPAFRSRWPSNGWVGTR